MKRGLPPPTIAEALERAHKYCLAAIGTRRGSEQRQLAIGAVLLLVSRLEREKRTKGKRR